MRDQRRTGKSQPLIVFVDRSLGSKIVPEALRVAGEQVIVHDVRFPNQETPDTDWLAAAGAAGWTVLTCDQRIQYRPLERQALMSAGTLVIVLAGDMPGPQMADLIVRALPKIRHVATNETRPALLKLRRDGRLVKIKL